VNLRKKRDEEVELNLTPLIDVVFLLLIFFMVTTSFNKLAAIKIELPEADGEVSEAPAKLIEISIDQSGNYFINQQPLVNSQVDTLRRAIEKESQGQLDIPFVISADGRTPHQSVVTVMDMAARLGFFHLTFSTKKPSESGE
jgi:biopolymer transport protein ExbD